MATSPLLTYACITDPFPLQANPASGTAVATFQVEATNATGAAVVLEAISIQLPVGPGADALTLDPTGIVAAPPAGWKQAGAQSSPGVIVYTFLPGGAVTLAVGDSLAFALNQVEVNQAAGTATLTVTQGSGGCAPADCPTEALLVTKFPAGWGIVEFSAVDPDVNPGEDASVQWSGPPGATYTLQYYTPATGVVNVPAPGAAPLGPMGTYPGVAAPPLPLQQTTVFTLDVAYTAGGATYSAQRQANVVVVPPAPTITRFDGQLSGPLDALVLTLTWATENATTCELTGTSEQLDAQGTRSFPNPVDTGPILPVYTLTAHGAPGLDTSAVFEVPPRVTRFTAASAMVGESRQLVLTWATWLGEACTITGVPGVLAASGSVPVTPTAQAPLLSDYTLTATARGKTDTSTLSPQWSGQPAAQQTLPIPLPMQQTLPIPGGSLTPSEIEAALLAAAPDGGVIVTPDGRVIVPIQQAVSLFSSGTLQPLAPPSIPVATDAGTIAINPAGTRVFIAHGTTLAAYDAQTFQPTPASPVPIPVQPGSGGAGLAVASTGDRVFVCSAQTTSVAVLNADTLQLVEVFQLPGPAGAVAATPDGRHLVFAG
ncbi:MAG TPA: hypothetical protein VGB15_08345, partial [Longimicrobium sp.]